MPRPKAPPRLRLRKDGAARIWVIKDGSNYIRTGCPEQDFERAEKRLAKYLADKYEPPVSTDPQAITCADILNYYALNRVPQLANPRNEADFITQLVPFWAARTLFDVGKPTSREYAALRLSMGVTAATARRELECLRAAINYYVDEKKVPYRPKIELPPKGESRVRWLSRDEAARFIHAARRRGNHHLARLILIGIYTGTRTGAIKRMRWLPSIDAGHFDLTAGVMYRRGSAERQTTKRRPHVRIPSRLLPHLKRWRKLDGGCVSVIHRDGIQPESVRKAWANSRTDAGLSGDVVPHTLRHTCASWGMQNIQNSNDLPVLSNFLGMSLKMLLEVYGHQNPDHQKSAIDAISRRPGRL